MSEESRSIKRGQLMAFAVSLAAIGGAVYCAHIGQPKVALGILVTYAGGVVAALFTKP